MKKKNTLKLLVCVMLCTLVVYAAQAQTDSGGARRGGGMPGGFGGMGFSRGPSVPAGPPAPVPPQVAIQRPTADEVDKMNAELQRFIETNTSAAKDLFKKYASLVKVQVPRANPAVAPVQTGVRTTERHNGFVETAKQGDFDILFHGDSITDWWQRSGVEAQKKYFGDIKIANFAIAGDTTQGLLWGLQNGEGQGKPKAIMLMIGTNNASGNATAEEVAEGVGAVVLQLRKDFPNAKIMLLAIFPRGAGPDDAIRRKNDETNKIIAKLHDGEHVFFTDINKKFMKEDGSLIGFSGDNLHPDAQGYDIWGAAVSDTLKSWLN